MATLPNSTITVVPPEAPEDAEFPTPDPIQSFDLVGKTAANRQPNALKIRDLTLRARVNQLIANMNEISTGEGSAVLFLPRDGTNAMTGDLAMGGKKITGLAAGTANSDAIRKDQVVENRLWPTPTGTPDDYVQVTAGTYQKTTGKGYKTVGAQSVQITTSVGGGETRYDLVHINDAGALGVTQGVAGTPGTVPEFPDDKLTLAVVKVDETGTIEVIDTDITDVRPFLSADQDARTLQTYPIDDAAPDVGDMLRYEAGKWTPSAVVSLPTNYIGGLITSNSGDADHDIDIAKGQCRDVGDTANMVLSSVLTKQIDGLWVVGDDQPGLDAGAVAADTLYALWLIKRTDTGVVDAIFSTSFTTPDPTRIPDYDKKRLIGAVCTGDPADIIAYIQSGDYFRYMGAVILDVDNTEGDIAAGETWYDAVLSVPPLCLAHIYGGLSNISAIDAGHNKMWIRTKGAVQGFGNAEAWMFTQVDANSDYISVQGMIFVDSASKVEYAARQLNGDAIVNITTIGFTMLTRREP